MAKIAMENEPNNNDLQPSPTVARGPGGKFAAGNQAAAGNPLARKVQQLRVALANAIGTKDIRAIARKMIEEALTGDTTAAKLVFDRALGPAEAIDLAERLEIVEEVLFREEKP